MVENIMRQPKYQAIFIKSRLKMRICRLSVDYEEEEDEEKKVDIQKRIEQTLEEFEKYKGVILPKLDNGVNYNDLKYWNSYN